MDNDDFFGSTVIAPTGVADMQVESPTFVPGATVVLGSPSPTESKAKATPEKPKKPDAAKAAAAAQKAADDAAAEGPKLNGKAEKKPSKNKAEGKVEGEPQAKRHKSDPEGTDSDSDEPMEKKKKAPPKPEQSESDEPKKVRKSRKAPFTAEKYAHLSEVVLAVVNALQTMVCVASDGAVESFPMKVFKSVETIIERTRELKAYKEKFEKETHLNIGAVLADFNNMLTDVEAGETHAQLTATGIMLRERITGVDSPLRSLIAVVSNAMNTNAVHDVETKRLFAEFCYLTGSTKESRTPICEVLAYLALFHKRISAKANKTPAEVLLRAALRSCAPGLLVLGPFHKPTTLLVRVGDKGACEYRLISTTPVTTGVHFKNIWADATPVAAMLGALSCIGEVTRAKFNVDVIGPWIKDVESSVADGEPAKKSRTLLDSLTAPLIDTIVIARNLKDTNKTVTAEPVVKGVNSETQMVLHTAVKDARAFFYMASVDARVEPAAALHYHYALETKDEPLVCFNVQSGLSLAALVVSEKLVEKKLPVIAPATEVVDLSESSPPPKARVLQSPARAGPAPVAEKPPVTPPRAAVVIQKAEAEAAKAKAAKVAEEPKLAAEPKPRVVPQKPEEKKYPVSDTVAIVMDQALARIECAFLVHADLSPPTILDWAKTHTGAKSADALKPGAAHPLTGDQVFEFPSEIKRIVVVIPRNSLTPDVGPAEFVDFTPFSAHARITRGVNAEQGPVVGFLFRKAGQSAVVSMSSLDLPARSGMIYVVNFSQPIKTLTAKDYGGH